MSVDPYNISPTMTNVFIGISGLIGAGKSTLAEKLAKRLDLPIFKEPVIDNIYLEDFYKDMKKYAFPLQVYLLNQRFKQHQQIIWQDIGGVQDRTIYEDSVFAKVLRDQGDMEERDYETYLELFRNMSNFMQKPTMIVHLDVTPEESMRRVEMRARGCETGVQLEYLQRLYKAYEEFIGAIAKVIPVIKIRWDEFRTADEVVDRIALEYAKLANVRAVTFD
ncbi:Deoxynucleoside kinase [Carpediemonas membranifera]|uniref:Deoxynucleoside kinase n=1 Tax=Carpediemonas membranifera TaxID=201153 RepID=A0A8J6B360_9EUKA|nr:Deoxynucleoside kinase [Carpediemonas membranifera]|eukprot:KAG9394728.1 Deoxynucleoside kinase [Carpediemonas membranifera]